MSERILVVEDEPAIAESIAYSLAEAGYEVDTLRDGEAALRVAADDYDLVLLDVVLPRISGLEVCRRLRAASAVPILILTARASEVDRILGLEGGADEYIAKPFSMPELLSRVRAILRRRLLDSTGSDARRRRVGSLELDLVAQTLRVEGRLVDVTPTELRLLAVLAERPERAVSRAELVRSVSRQGWSVDARACDVHVKNIRRKVERDAARPERLVTVRGVGYMLRP